MAYTYGIIPARWGSTRFPGKPLHLIAGKPLVQHVWERCQDANGLARVIIATDDSRISAVARGFGAEVEMTSTAHATGTDRLAEVAERHPEATHFLNIQGDEPTIPPTLINELAAVLAADPHLDMATCATLVRDPADVDNPNCVKVVRAANGDALYFSRSPIPFRGYAGAHAPLPLRHQGIYAYTRGFLERFVRWPQGDLERFERLEQLRALENGARIRVIVTDHESLGVDSPDDVPRAEEALAQALFRFPLLSSLIS